MKLDEAFIKRFVHEDGTIEGGTQTSYVLALEFDLLPQELRPLAAAELVRNIQERAYHLSTGFVGTPYINWVLTEDGSSGYCLCSTQTDHLAFLALFGHTGSNNDLGTLGWLDT